MPMRGTDAAARSAMRLVSPAVPGRDPDARALRPAPPPAPPPEPLRRLPRRCDPALMPLAEDEDDNDDAAVAALPGLVLPSERALRLRRTAEALAAPLAPDVGALVAADACFLRLPLPPPDRRLLERERDEDLEPAAEEVLLRPLCRKLPLLLLLPNTGYCASDGGNATGSAAAASSSSCGGCCCC